LGASSYPVDAPKRFTASAYDFYVVKDAQGFYAVDTACTHEGVAVTIQGSGFYCPRHGATFDINGKHLSGPGSGYLQHYAVCVDASGNVSVDYTTDASNTQRF
jgi:nitrite reductase/ring-hydroxylating ferredoxin subunit